MFLDAILQVAQNVTQTLPTINIPATITPTFAQTAPVVASAAADPFGILTIINSAIAAFTLYQGKKNDVKQSTRANALADSQIDIVNSQKQTDIGVQQLVTGIDMTTQKLAENPNNKSLLETPLPELEGKTITEYLKQQRAEWTKDIKSYYQDTSPTPKEFSKDPVVAKTAAVTKLATPSTG